MPSKIWAVGEEVLAADFNDYVQEQVVATFPNAAARTAAIAAPLPGMLTYLADVGRLEQYTDKATPAGWSRPWGEAWGRIGEVTPPNITLTGVVFIPGTSITIATAGRRMEYTLTGYMLKPDGVVGAGVLSVNIGGGAASNDVAVTLSPNWRGTFTLRHTYVNLTGAVSVVGQCDNGSVLAQGMRATLDDLGPM